MLCVTSKVERESLINENAFGLRVTLLSVHRETLLGILRLESTGCRSGWNGRCVHSEYPSETLRCQFVVLLTWDRCGSKVVVSQESVLVVQ